MQEETEGAGEHPYQELRNKSTLDIAHLLPQNPSMASPLWEPRHKNKVLPLMETLSQTCSGGILALNAKRN